MKEKEVIIHTVSSDDPNPTEDRRQPASAHTPDAEARLRGSAPIRTRRGAARTSSRREKRKRSNKQKIVALVLSVLLLLVLIGGCKFFMMLSSPFFGDDIDEDILNAQDAVVSDMVSVLLVGTDGGGTNTDTLMLAVLNCKTKAVDLISIPRDTRVPNPYGNSGYVKINSVYAAKGMAGLISQVRDVTGMPINFYAMIDFEGFRKAIDVLGGVKFDVPERLKYDDPLQDLHIDLYPGMQLLDGDKAEQLVRCRNSYAQADLRRTEVQRDFIKATLEQHATAANLLKLDDLYKTLDPYVKTSITLGDALKFGTSVVGVKSENIQSHMLPGEAGAYGANSISYFIYDAKAMEALAQEIGYTKAMVVNIPAPGKANDGKKEAASGTKKDADTAEKDSETTSKKAEKDDKDDDSKKDSRDENKANSKEDSKDKSSTANPSSSKTGNPSEQDRSSSKSEDTSKPQTPANDTPREPTPSAPPTTDSSQYPDGI